MAPTALFQHAIVTELGVVRVRQLALPQDAAMAHQWLTHPHSSFWGATDWSLEKTTREYTAILTSPDQQAFILELADQPLALVEVYAPATSPLAEPLAGQVEFTPSDAGMHILIAPPPPGPGTPGLTTALFAATMCLIFDALQADRVVVEPDERNAAIHAKNALAGFRDVARIPLPGKNARVQLCSRADFLASRMAGLACLDVAPSVSPSAPRAASGQDLADTGGLAPGERELIAKMIREFSHERLLTPRLLSTGQWQVTLGNIELTFAARRHPVEHLAVDAASLRTASGAAPPGLVDLVAQAASQLGIPEASLHTYLAELAATVAGSARTARLTRPSAAELASLIVGGQKTSTGAEQASSASGPVRRSQARLMQYVEQSMTGGHPGFLANAGRGGMGESELYSFAPELGRSTQLVWLAAQASACVTAASASCENAPFSLDQAPACLEAAATLEALGHRPEDYVAIPVHPWQWEHRITTEFSGELASGELVALGAADLLMYPQQSLRTFFNLTDPAAPYVKTALTVRNMGFYRGLSPKYMRDTPAINDWLAGLLEPDKEFRAAHVRLLKEFAAVGFTGDAFHATATSGTGDAHTKMLAALWRESPIPQLAPGSQAITLAAVLHHDASGIALAGELIAASEIPAREWVARLLDVYLLPAVHALCQYDVVFMPHSENVILELDRGVPVGSFFKDLGEEVAVVRASRKVPAGISRIVADDGSFTDVQRALSIHTDIVDGVLRHLGALLDASATLPEAEFWQVARECLAGYFDRWPAARDRLPLLARTFPHSCLNRLQLRNPEGMVTLGDQESSLIYAGEMTNPLAPPE